MDCIRKVVAGHSLTREEAAEAAGAIMDGRATPAQIGALLTALRMKGETLDEVTGFALGLRARSVPVCPRRQPLLDTCGTGGGTFRVFNVSTAAAFVAAAAGIAVAKHGNRAATGVCGSADVLEALGARLPLSPERAAACIDAEGIAFLFAQSHHPAMKNAAGPRREIGIRTLFNLVGPLSNPAGATLQVMGVSEPRLVPLAAGALAALGARRALVAHGEIGLCEIATSGITQISELRDGEIHHYQLTPAHLGLSGTEPAPDSLAPAATPAANAVLLQRTLSGFAGSPDERARLDLVAVNAAAALRVGGLVEEWPDAVELARSVLESGAAARLLDRFVAFTTAA